MQPISLMKKLSKMACKEMKGAKRLQFFTKMPLFKYIIFVGKVSETPIGYYLSTVWGRDYQKERGRYQYRIT